MTLVCGFSKPAMYDSSGLKTSPFSRIFVAFLALVSVMACGVQFSSPSADTELFKSIEIEGNLAPDSILSLTISLNRSYPVPVRIACFYENPANLTKDQMALSFHERASKIGETVLTPRIKASPNDDLELETLVFTFTIADPGDYTLACLTPASPENALGVAFSLVVPSAE